MNEYTNIRYKIPGSISSPAIERALCQSMHQAPPVPIIRMYRRLTPIADACKALPYILRFERQLARQGGHVWTFGTHTKTSSGSAVR